VEPGESRLLSALLQAYSGLSEDNSVADHELTLRILYSVKVGTRSDSWILAAMKIKDRLIPLILSKNCENAFRKVLTPHSEKKSQRPGRLCYG
jgi:hypothetical protein